jgi:cation diffusion facilitator CzcD-associated flavoprotein CzcO
MNMTHKDPILDGDHIFKTWLNKFAVAFEAKNPERLAGLFSENGHWKDLLSFTWEHRVFSGREKIRHAFNATLDRVDARNFRCAEGGKKARVTTRSRRQVVEGYFDFDTNAGKGTAFARLVLTEDEPDEPRAWIVLTTLQQLHGFEEKVGERRPSGDEYSKNVNGHTWLEDRATTKTFANREPQVIVIGAGHAGLVAAARLGQIGVDVLVVEKSQRVGDVWRKRYKSLTLHNEIMANHLPYLPFPKTWPVWLTKDHLANWLEAYAECLELNVWTGTILENAKYSEEAQQWSVHLRLADGNEREMTCRHIVVATGVSGSIPHVPKMPGLETFGGDAIHSSEFYDGATYRGKNAIVVGTGNSAHDVAQELLMKGAKTVAMLQRGPTCVISLKPGAQMIYKIFDEEHPTDDIDLMAAAIPYPLLEDTYRWITSKAAKFDESLLNRLNKGGFKTYFGRDGTGFQMMYMRGEGGYYIDVGCSELIANGSVNVIQYDDIDGFNRDGLKLKDGRLIPCELVVLATGFKNMQENIRKLFGDEVAEKVGRVWGFDEHYQMRNMWRRTGQHGLWITGGALLDSRIFSRFLALEIKASLEDILPVKADLRMSQTDIKA